MSSPRALISTQTRTVPVTRNSWPRGVGPGSIRSAECDARRRRNPADVAAARARGCRACGTLAELCARTEGPLDLGDFFTNISAAAAKVDHTQDPEPAPSSRAAALPKMIRGSVNGSQAAG